MVCAPDGCFTYDTNNRLTVFDGYAVSYDLDGNMLSNGKIYCTYDSANRLTYAGGISYTYNAEDVRIRAFSEEEDTTYTYDTNCKLSKLLTKTTNGVTTKYVYGRGLIGEEVDNTFKIYHFDCRGSTVAITDSNGNVTDTFAYDTYGKLLTRTGTSNVIFGYNGRDGVVTDSNGLVYMRARYYSPDMRRFVNADIVAGAISNAITLNRFAYANGNPVSFVDPFGLSAERSGRIFSQKKRGIGDTPIYLIAWSYSEEDATWFELYSVITRGVDITIDGDISDWNEKMWSEFTKKCSFARAAYTRRQELLDLGIPESCIDIQRIDGYDDLVNTWEMWSGYAEVGGLDFYSHGYSEAAEVYMGSREFWKTAKPLNFVQPSLNIDATMCKIPTRAVFYGCNTANGEFAQNFANSQNVVVFAQTGDASFSHDATTRVLITTYDESLDVYLFAFESDDEQYNMDGLGKVFYPALN